MNAWVETLGWVLVHSLWQFTLIALVVWVIQRSLSDAPSTLRYVVMIVGMTALLVAPLMTWKNLELASTDGLTVGSQATSPQVLAPPRAVALAPARSPAFSAIDAPAADTLRLTGPATDVSSRFAAWLRRPSNRGCHLSSVCGVWGSAYSQRDWHAAGGRYIGYALLARRLCPTRSNALVIAPAPC